MEYPNDVLEMHKSVLAGTTCMRVIILCVRRYPDFVVPLLPDWLLAMEQNKADILWYDQKLNSEDERRGSCKGISMLKAALVFPELHPHADRIVELMLVMHDDKAMFQHRCYVEDAVKAGLWSAALKLINHGFQFVVFERKLRKPVLVHMFEWMDFGNYACLELIKIVLQKKPVYAADACLRALTDPSLVPMVAPWFQVLLQDHECLRRFFGVVRGNMRKYQCVMDVCMGDQMPMLTDEVDEPMAKRARLYRAPIEVVDYI